MSGYFLYHSIGTFPNKSALMAQALSRFSEAWSTEYDGQWAFALQERQAFIEAWQRLIAAPAKSLTTAENVTTALFSLIGGLPSGILKNKRVLVAADCFPSLHFLLAKLQTRFGFTLDTVPLRKGSKWVNDDDLIDRWGADVGLALLTFVSSTSSHRCDVARLAEHGRRMGSIVGVDLTQGVGIVPFSVAELPVDFVVSTSLKWLCGTSGAGILYVQPDLIQQCEPELRGWFSQENPFSWDLDTFSYAADARRFDHGTPAILASVASLPGLQWVENTGAGSIIAQNRASTERLVALAQDNGWTLASPLDPDERGGSIMITLPDHAAPTEIIAGLRERALYADARGATLRLSPGAVTKPDAIDALGEALKSMLRR